MWRLLEMLFLSLILLVRIAAIPSLSDSYLFEENSPRVAKSMMACPCSPSTRGYSVIHNFTKALQAYVEVLHEEESRSTMITLRDWDTKVRSKFHQCTEQFGFEACVNMDAALRSDCRFTVTVCIFDNLTGKNLLHSRTGRGFVSAKACDMLPRYSSHELYLGNAFPSHSPNPTSTHSTITNDPIFHFVPMGKSHFSSYSCEPSSPRNTPKLEHPSQLHDLPSIKASPFPASAGNSTNDRPTQSSSHPLHFPLSTVSGSSFSPSAIDAKLSEGCVAVEHLQGHEMQHKVNLRRNVLCYRRFCATANHAIIVAGKTTSMDKMCRETWPCTKDVKMVNNLNLFVNRRAKAEGGIIITPYDYRFPRLFAWIAQGFGQLIA